MWRRAAVQGGSKGRPTGGGLAVGGGEEGAAGGEGAGGGGGEEPGRPAPRHNSMGRCFLGSLLALYLRQPKPGEEAEVRRGEGERRGRGTEEDGEHEEDGDGEEDDEGEDVELEPAEGRLHGRHGVERLVEEGHEVPKDDAQLGPRELVPPERRRLGRQRRHHRRPLPAHLQHHNPLPPPSGPIHCPPRTTLGRELEKGGPSNQCPLGVVSPCRIPRTHPALCRTSPAEAAPHKGTASYAWLANSGALGSSSG